SALAPSTVTSRPFDGHGSGSFINANGGFFASGIATHLGAFTHFGTLQLTPTANPAVFAVSGRTTSVAANGATLCAGTNATWNVTAGVASGTAAGDGGAGRFADARGTVALRGQLLPGGTIEFALKGASNF